MASRSIKFVWKNSWRNPKKSKSLRRFSGETSVACADPPAMSRPVMTRVLPLEGPYIGAREVPPTAVALGLITYTKDG
jgi:hypothetical protein